MQKKSATKASNVIVRVKEEMYADVLGKLRKEEHPNARNARVLR